MGLRVVPARHVIPFRANHNARPPGESRDGFVNDGPWLGPAAVGDVDLASLPWLSRIQAPTLVIVGDDDPLVPTSNALMMACRIPHARVFVGEGEGHFQLLDPESQAVHAIPEFLGAPALDNSAVWRAAREVDRADADMQIRSDGLGALPWGAVSAFVRQLVR